MKTQHSTHGTHKLTIVTIKKKKKKMEEYLKSVGHGSHVKSYYNMYNLQGKLRRYLIRCGVAPKTGCNLLYEILMSNDPILIKFCNLYCVQFLSNILKFHSASRDYHYPPTDNSQIFYQFFSNCVPKTDGLCE